MSILSISNALVSLAFGRQGNGFLTVLTSARRSKMNRDNYDKEILTLSDLEASANKKLDKATAGKFSATKVRQGLALPELD